MKRSSGKLSILSLQYYCFPDDFGGAWNYTYQVNRRLVERGHPVFLITCKPDDSLADEESISGIHYFRIGKNDSKSIFRLARAIRRQIKTITRNNPVHCIHAHNPLVAFLALLVPTVWRIPKVYHFHSLWTEEEKINRSSAPDASASWTDKTKLAILLRFIYWVEWTCFRTSSLLLFLSQYSLKKFQQAYPGLRSTRRLIPGGVDTREFCPPLGSVENIRHALHLPPAVPVLLTVRRLEARMGLENLLHALSILKKDSPELKFYLAIVGGGSLRTRLDDLIHRLGLENEVRLAGKVSQEDLMSYYQAADVFILPTTHIEGFGLATVEALACGLPVLGTPVGGTLEILEPIDPKLLFEGTDPQSLAQGIKKFLQTPQDFFQLKTRCREETVNKYDWEIVVDQLEQELVQVGKCDE